MASGIPQETIRVFIVDDHAIVREGLRVLMNRHNTFQLVGEAGTGQEAIEKIPKCNPDVVVLDLKMPDMDGFETARLIRERNPAVRTLVLSAEISPGAIVKARKLGITGVVAKQSLFSELIAAVQAVHSGDIYCCMYTRQVMLEECAFTSCSRLNTDDSLTSEEREMIQLLTEGMTIGQVALHFSRSPKTIDARKRKTMEKLGITNLADLTKYAIREGLTSY
ncbi:MAG: response regulator transcription factor [Sedimentisphaerales bacterium]|nr:response regulator transcription factor [Sedimentisphaerales bacterium]